MDIIEFLKKINELIGTDKLISGIILLLIPAIEISPIKINPWTFIKKISITGLTMLGELLNQGLNNKIDKMDKDVTYLKTELKKMNDKIEFVESKDDERDAINTRNRILLFGDDIMHGILHSKDSYEQTLSDISHYNTYCNEHPDFKNHITEYHARLIESRYREHLDNNDFLQ